MSERLKIEIASNTSPVFLPQCVYLDVTKNGFNFILLCKGRKKTHPNACHLSSFYVYLILNEQQASKVMACSEASLGQVETAYWALFSPMLLQEMNALYWSCLSPHCFSGPGLCGTVCIPAHTAAIMSLQHPSCSCEHLCPSQFICSGIHSERNCGPRTKSGPCFAKGMSWALPHSSSHLVKKNKQIEAGFDVCTSGACGVRISSLCMESPFTTSDPEQERVKSLQGLALR